MIVAEANGSNFITVPARRPFDGEAQARQSPHRHCGLGASGTRTLPNNSINARTLTQRKAPALLLAVDIAFEEAMQRSWHASIEGDLAPTAAVSCCCVIIMAATKAQGTVELQAHQTNRIPIMHLRQHAGAMLLIGDTSRPQAHGEAIIKDF